MSSNQLAAVAVERSTDTKESEVAMIHVIPDVTVDLYKG